MRRHLGTWVLGGLIGTLVLSSDALAGHTKQKCDTSQASEKGASEQGASEQAATPQEESPPKEKCPPKKCCQFQIFPKHKSCFDWPEKVVQPCIVPPCPAPPAPCPPIVHFPPPPPPHWENAPTGQGQGQGQGPAPEKHGS